MTVSDWDETTNVTDAHAIVSPEQTERDQAYLIVLAGSCVGEMHKLDKELVIGRGRGADIRLIDDGVSRLHAKISLTSKGLVVEDLESRNGTFCNGDRVDARPLKDGDKIQVGRTTILKFTYHDNFDDSFQRQMYDSALRDGLTKVFNKRYFDDRLNSEFRFAHRHEVPLNLLLLDLDHFKKVNDQHGHLAGDHVLQVFATAIQESVRNEDVFARYGGEEFAVITRVIGREEAKAFGERLRSLVEGLEIDHGGVRIPITMSVGVAGLPENKVDSPLDLVAAADRALYWAKAKGRNCVAAADDDENEDTAPT